MKIRMLLTLLILLLTISADAQRRKSVRTKPTPEEIQRQEKMERMRAATEKVVFIDSFVVGKQDFLKLYKLSSETGSIKRTKDLFPKEKDNDSYAYVNERGNRCLLAKQETDSTSNLYGSDYESGAWTSPTLLRGINDNHQYKRVNFPFLMGDGTTLYFAAEGGDGIGGYDIYMTTYDDENDQFLQPLNIGMPFNSEANDYMYAIDEYDSLGWFVTDRRQPIDTVCVYVFIPSQVRQNYSPEVYTPEQINNFALITSITDTWTDERELLRAIARLRSKYDYQPVDATNSGIRFVINDDITYRRIEDFKAPDNVKRFQHLQALLAQRQQIEESLEQARGFYAQANSSERRLLNVEIRTGERRLLKIHERIHTTEKNIRNAENIFLTNTQ